MSDPTILIMPKQGISAADKRALVKIGVVVIEMDDPQQARLIRASSELSSTDLLGAAARTIKGASSDTVRAAFANSVCALLENASNRAVRTDDGAQP